MNIHGRFKRVGIDMTRNSQYI